MKRELRAIGGAALASALALLGVHCASLVLLVPAWRALAPAAREAMGGIAPHLAAFQAALAVAVASVGAVFGAVGWLALRALHVRASARRSVAVAMSGCTAVVLHAVARKPALFEALLWRKGGVRAAVQVLIADRIGVRVLDAFIVAAIAGTVVAALWRNRERLRDRRVVAAGALAAALVGLLALPRARTAHLSGRPIVVVAADSLRPDHFSSEGYPRPTTPNLDRLRVSAGWVEDEFVPIASTTSSWASLMTGTYPHTHGVRHLFPRAEQTRILLPTVPRLLAAHGYSTAVVSDYAGESFSRIDLGFATVDAPPATSLEIFAEREAFQRLPLALAFFSGRIAQRFFPVAQYLPVNADPADLTERAFAQLDRLERAGKPFFLLVFYSVTHAPFAAPMPDATAFSAANYEGPSRYSYEIQQIDDIARASLPVTDAEAGQVRALYDGALRSFDREVGRLLARLDADGVKDRILIVTGDHGENLFEPQTTTEHGKWFRGGEAANRTALVVEAPQVRPGRLAGLVSGIDFAPTLLDLAGIAPPATMEGRSLLLPEDPSRIVFAETAIWLGGKADAPPGALAYPDIASLLEVEEGSHALVLKERYEGSVVGSKLRAARQGRWEATYMPTTGAPKWQLFDLERDRYAEHDVSSAHPDEMLRFENAIRGWLAQDPLRWLDVNDRAVARYER